MTESEERKVAEKHWKTLYVLGVPLEITIKKRKQKP